MFSPISHEALTKLVKEMTRSIHFTPWVLNRLRNEDPHYEHMAMFFAKKARDELGGIGFKITLNHFAYAYRIMELSAHVFMAIDKEAMMKLVEEGAQSPQFASLVLNRLKREDPHYEHMAMFFAKKARDELGDAGFNISLDHFAYAYRIMELGQQHKTPRQNYPEKEPERSPEEIAFAEALFVTLLERLRQPLKK
jgi:hypothetical protein